MNGGCINARCELTEEGSTICLCDDGYTMLENNKECADNCAPGYNMDMGTGECTSAWLIFALLSNLFHESQGRSPVLERHYASK